MVLPEADALTIHKNIPGAKLNENVGFTVPCDTNASLVLAYGGQSFTIDPRDLAFAPLGAQGDCVSGIASSGNGSENGPATWIVSDILILIVKYCDTNLGCKVGDTFLKNAYFSTDISKNTVSLAKLA